MLISKLGRSNSLPIPTHTHTCTHPHAHTHTHTHTHSHTQIKSDFMEMLGESEAITERSQWKKMKSFFDRDTRYKAVESSTKREEWFKEYVSNTSNQTDPEQEKQERIQARSVNNT